LISLRFSNRSVIFIKTGKLGVVFQLSIKYKHGDCLRLNIVFSLSILTATAFDVKSNAFSSEHRSSNNPHLQKVGRMACTVNAPL